MVRFLFQNYRLPIVAFAAAAGAGASFAQPAFTAGTEPELRVALERATGQHVDSIAWEASRGVVADQLSGRRMLFLASSRPDGPRDLYRARVRVSFEGKPLELQEWVNLTNTPIGDEHALSVTGTRAVFSTFSFDTEQAVTVLDLSGEGAQNLTETLTDKAMAAFTNLQNTGCAEGIGRIDIAFDEPARSVTAQLDGQRLTLDLERNGLEHIELDLSQPELAPPGVRIEPARHLPKRFIFWAVDSVRAVPWIGPAPIAWLEERVFAVKDKARRLAHAGSDEKIADLATLEAEVLPAASFNEKEPMWPPAPITSPWATPEAGEGEWTPPTQPWVKRLPNVGSEEAPVPFLTTFVRPDEKRPYARVLFVAMDMRQLELGMQAGVEDPEPLSGPKGTGRLPRDPAVYKRTAAAFNGGFKTEHGSYGMMVERRILLPGMPGAATIAAMKDGTVQLGTWGKEVKTGGPNDANLLSFRQNVDPLVEDGVLNPAKRSQWGFTLPETGMQTERSGVCMTAQGQLMYAWGDDVSADTLAKAMRIAACTYGIHLDMNPHHTGFTFTNIDELKGRKYKSELLTKKMEISPERYIEYAPKDFFYLLLRDPTPPAIAREGAEALAWTAMALSPPPKFLPALHTAQIADVELLSVAAGRVDYRLRAGAPESEKAAALELPEADSSRVLLALGLGAGGSKSSVRRGLVVSGARLGEAVGGEQRAWLSVDASGKLAATDAPPEAAAADAIEVQVLAKNGVAVAGAKAAGIAFGFAKDGRLLVARAAKATDLTAALLAAGALDAYAGIDTERGTMYLADTERPLRKRYDEATLSVLAAPMAPRVTRFVPAVPYEKPPPPKKKN